MASYLRVTDSLIASYICNVRLWYDEHAGESSTVLAIRNRSGSNLHTLLQHHRFPLNTEDKGTMAMAETEQQVQSS
jgi:hypothetical protein